MRQAILSVACMWLISGCSDRSPAGPDNSAPSQPAPVTPPPAPPTPPAGSSSWDLVFAGRDDRQIYRIALDGTGTTQLTNTGRNFRAAVSPDGARIAFIRYEEGGIHGLQADIYLMDTDGLNVVRRTTNADFWWAAWSPDGRKLAVSDENIYNASIYLISAEDDGGVPKLLAGYARSPVWSPDGKQIAFIRLSGDDGYNQVFIMNSDGTEQRAVTELDGGGIFGMTWSPDGERVAYSKCLYGSCGLYTIKTDGSDPKTVTAQWYVGAVDWSPDGQWIAAEVSASNNQWLPSVAYFSPEGGLVRILSPGSSPSWRRGVHQ